MNSNFGKIERKILEKFLSNFQRQDVITTFFTQSGKFKKYNFSKNLT